MSFPIDPERFISLDHFNKQQNQIMSSFELAPPDPSEDSTPIDPFQSTVSDPQNTPTILGPDFEPQNGSTGISLPPGFEPRQNNDIPELNIESFNSNNNSVRFDGPEEPSSSSRLSPPPPPPLSQEHQFFVLTDPDALQNLQRVQDDIAYTSVNNSNTNKEFSGYSSISTITSNDEDNESRLLQYRLNKRVESFRINKREECMAKSSEKVTTSKASSLTTSKNSLSNSDDNNSSTNQNFSNSTSTLKRTAEQINTSKEESLEQINDINEESLIDIVKKKRQEEKEIENSSKEKTSFEYQYDVAGNGRNTRDSDKIDNVKKSLPSISSKFIDGSSKKYL